jgi:two-component system, NtrC family, response regulator HupR/HoxA
VTARADGPVETPTVLIVDDEPRVLDALEAILAAEFRVVRAGGGEAALDTLKADEVAVIVTDYRMPGMTGVELLRRSQEHAPEAVRIILTAYTDVDSLMEAINTGRIYQFVPKPWDPNELLLIVRRAAERHALARENVRLRDELEVAYNAARRELAAIRARPLAFDTLIGAQGGLRAATELAGKVLDGDTTVLLTGETGTGKELFARLIHDNGRRHAKSFVAQNCGALPESLLESELFGHARGAFTGATADRRGLFEEAHGGTMFLDEVGEMSPAMQLRLLRVLQEGELRRVGETTTRRVDVRVIAATNADLEGAAAGTFRRDLFYRLNVFPIHLPPLRERAGDIPALAEHFLAIYRTRARRAVPSITPEAMARLRAYPFPGNVRELENEIERAVALVNPGEPIAPEHLSERVRVHRPAADTPSTLNDAIELLKRRMIDDALRECGSKTRAAERLGLTRQSLQQMLRRRNI